MDDKTIAPGTDLWGLVAVAIWSPSGETILLGLACPSRCLHALALVFRRGQSGRAYGHYVPMFPKSPRGTCCRRPQGRMLKRTAPARSPSESYRYATQRQTALTTRACVLGSISYQIQTDNVYFRFWAAKRRNDG